MLWGGSCCSLSRVVAGRSTTLGRRDIRPLDVDVMREAAAVGWKGPEEAAFVAEEGSWFAEEEGEGEGAEGERKGLEEEEAEVMAGNPCGEGGWEAEGLWGPLVRLWREAGTVDGVAEVFGVSGGAVSMTRAAARMSGWTWTVVRSRLGWRGKSGTPYVPRRRPSSV